MYTTALNNNIKMIPIGNGLRGIEWSRDRWHHVTQNGQTRDRDPNMSAILETGWLLVLSAVLAVLLLSLHLS